MTRSTAHTLQDTTEAKGTRWHKSSLSGARQNCVEVAVIGDTVAVRDTKDRDGGALIFTQDEWQAFVGGVQRGEFDLPPSDPQL
jgi:hypothetical protein